MMNGDHFLSLSRASLALLMAAFALFGPLPMSDALAAPLSAGVAKVDITNVDAGPVNDRLWVKALVIKSDATTAVIVTLDAVAVGEIGHIKNDYLPKVRARIEKELGIKPTNVLVNASHCHGVVCSDVDERTVQAVKLASQNMVPVHVGAGARSRGSHHGEPSTQAEERQRSRCPPCVLDAGRRRRGGSRPD